MRHTSWIGLARLSLWLAACQPAPGPTPAFQTATAPPPATLPASPVILPVVPSRDETQRVIGQNEPTAAAVANRGEGVDATGSPPVLPTEASLPMQFNADDGLTLYGTFYAAAQRPAPAVLLLHMLGSESAAWAPLAPALQAAGYNALALDMRGHGRTGGAQDWPRAQSDIAVVLEGVSALPGVDAARLALVGASIGANLALNACVDSPACRTAVLLSPGLDYRGVTSSEAITRLDGRAALIVASNEDAQSADSSRTLRDLAAQAGLSSELILFDGAGHGTRMFGPQPDLAQTILDWLNAHIGE